MQFLSEIKVLSLGEWLVFRCYFRRQTRSYSDAITGVKRVYLVFKMVLFSVVLSYLLGYLCSRPTSLPCLLCEMSTKLVNNIDSAVSEASSSFFNNLAKLH